MVVFHAGYALLAQLVIEHGSYESGVTGSSPVRSRSNFFFLSHKKIKILIIIYTNNSWRTIEASHRARPAPVGLVVNALLVALVALLIHAVPTATAAISKAVDEARPNP